MRRRPSTTIHSSQGPPARPPRGGCSGANVSWHPTARRYAAHRCGSPSRGIGPLLTTSCKARTRSGSPQLTWAAGQDRCRTGRASWARAMTISRPCRPTRPASAARATAARLLSGRPGPESRTAAGRRRPVETGAGAGRPRVRGPGECGVCPGTGSAHRYGDAWLTWVAPAPAVPAAHSTGAQVPLHAAVRAPGRAAAFVLLGPTFPPHLRRPAPLVRAFARTALHESPGVLPTVPPLPPATIEQTVPQGARSGGAASDPSPRAPSLVSRSSLADRPTRRP